MGIDPLPQGCLRLISAQGGSQAPSSKKAVALFEVAHPLGIEAHQPDPYFSCSSPKRSSALSLSATRSSIRASSFLRYPTPQ